MFGVQRTVIDGSDYERIESDYRMKWEDLGGKSEFKIRTPWLHRFDSAEYPCCTCKGNPKLTRWTCEGITCSCGEHWELGWGEVEFFAWPREQQTEAELMDTLRELETVGGPVLTRSTTDGQEEESKDQQLAARD